MKEGYLPKEQRKKILLLCDDIRMHSGVSTMAREFVLGTCHKYNWINAGAAINHPEVGKKIDLSQDTGNRVGIKDASVFLFPQNGYGDSTLLRRMLNEEKPDAVFFFTDPRYWEWLFQIENEVRAKVPMIYLNIWDNYPAPMYNQDYYESCDALLAISKQTKNINKLVLGEKSKNKIIEYVPHGINENHFFPIDENHKSWEQLQVAKKQLFGDKEYDHVFFFNSRNIRRKNPTNLIAAYSLFKENLPEDKKDKVALVLHTQPVDNNGTDLFAVRDLFLGEDDSVRFSQGKLSTEGMNFLYNLADITVLPSNAEGWGLALTESMMAGTMIMATVTGGMQDQMRFEDESGNWFTPTAEIPSNHRGTYKKHGKWAIPVFPATRNLVGSPKTPYIYDDQIDFEDLSNKMMESYNMSKKTIKENGLAGREWVTSDESMQSARHMNKNIIKYVDQTLNTFKPPKKFTFHKVENKKPKQLQHKLVY